MSHFTVMVIGDDVEAQLAPYHEYECTGIDDEYVIDVDCTEEVEEWLNKILWVGISKETGEQDYHFSEKSAIDLLDEWKTVTRIEWYKSTGQDIDTEIDEWFGYDERDGKYFNHTNPNSKWDWYQIGGRWAGFFKVKNPAEAEQGEKSWINKAQEIDPNYADVTIKGNVDIAAMMADIKAEKEIEFDQLESAIGDIEPLSWTKLRKDFEANGKTIEEAREAHRESDFQKAIVAYNKKHDTRIGDWLGNVYDDYYLHLPLNQARVRFAETAAMNVITPYAFIINGQWVQRGEMGWWGMSSNEMEKDDWSQKFYEMFKALPDDTLLTVVDCHI